MSTHAAPKERTLSERIADLSVARNALRYEILDLAEYGTWVQIQRLGVRIKTISKQIRDLEFLNGTP
jgi:hypothetical protein